MPAKSPATSNRKKRSTQRPERNTVARGPVSREVSHRPAPMPHERDERAETPAGKPDPDIKQAYKDIEAGQKDTDLRGTASGNFARSSGKRKQR
jgi:hypothetical protein